MTISITTRLLDAYRQTVPARKMLASIPWTEIPGLLAALGHEQSPEVAAVIVHGIGDGSAKHIVTLRNVLATIGDSVRPTHGGHYHHQSAAVIEMCAELVGLTGAALMLFDRTQRFLKVEPLDVTNPDQWPIA